MDSNRRSYERFGSDMIFWIKPLDTDEDLTPFDIENISGGGLLCNTTRSYIMGSLVLLNFELPQHTDLIDASALVRHVKKMGEGKYQIGLEFQEVVGLENEQLLGYLEDLFK